MSAGQPDGGVLKKIIVPGTGYVTPEDGDDVEGEQRDVLVQHDVAVNFRSPEHVLLFRSALCGNAGGWDEV